MRSWKTFFLTALLTVGFTLPGCNDDYNCNCPPPLPFIDIQAVDLFQYRDLGNNDIRGYGSGPVPWQQYRLEVALTVNYHADLLPAAKGWPSLSLIPAALACSCPPNGEEGSENKMTALTVVTLNDFDAAHVAGDTLTDVLEIFDLREGGPWTDLRDLVAEGPVTLFEEGFWLRLKKGSDSNPELSLDVTVTLDNGEQFRAVSAGATLE